jgi:hypothetical protein
MGSGVRRGLATVAAAAMVMAVALVGLAAAPAQAYTCSAGQSISFSNNSGVSRVSVTFYPRCSDNKAHWSGVVHDTSCDGRSGKVVLVANPAMFPDGSAGSVWDRAYHANNGCGTSASFSGSAYGLLPPWTLRVAAGACNSVTCAAYTNRYLYG